ncbi:MAG: hypothetical protein IPO03_20985 [Bacteroidetes bacterium]|nr:hypothetical protein [Bacteroidota bacterium]
MKKLFYKLIYKDGTNKIYWENIIFKTIVIGIFLSIFIPGVLKQRANDKELEANKRYTVGEINKVRKNIKSVFPTVHYTYTFDAMHIEGTDDRSTNGHNISKGTRYLVKFSPNNPTYAHILLDYPVPDSIFAPRYGWEKLPFNKPK